MGGAEAGQDLGGIGPRLIADIGDLAGAVRHVSERRQLRRGVQDRFIEERLRFVRGRGPCDDVP